MFTLLLAVLIATLAADIFFSAAAIYHLRTYTLPDWRAPRIVTPAYLALALLFAGFAVWSFLSIPF